MGRFDEICRGRLLRAATTGNTREMAAIWLDCGDQDLGEAAKCRAAAGEARRKVEQRGKGRSQVAACSRW
ncbi:hypothetical protein ACQJBY_032449 [Aegilops geniculata]